MSDKYHIGIDFGKKGGIVILKNGKIHFKRHMYTLDDKDTSEIDIQRIAALLNRFRKKDVHVIAEKFGGFFGYAKNAAVSINGQKEAILAVCKVLGIPATCYMPPQWQKVMFEGTTSIKKKGKVTGRDNKAMALSTVKRLFPKAHFLKSARSSKPHDGMVDAVLLAEFGRRKGL